MKACVLLLLALPCLDSLVQVAVPRAVQSIGAYPHGGHLGAWPITLQGGSLGSRSKIANTIYAAASGERMPLQTTKKGRGIGAGSLTLRASGQSIAKRVVSSSLLAVGTIQLVQPLPAGAVTLEDPSDSAIVRRNTIEGRGQPQPRWALAFTIDEDVGEFDDDEDLESVHDPHGKLAVAFADGEQVHCRGGGHTALRKIFGFCLRLQR